MTIECRFNIGERVTIKEIETKATVIGYKLDGLNLYVIITYWLCGKLEFLTIPEDELK